MTVELFLRYIHFVSIFAIVGTLSMEYILIEKSMTRQQLARLSRIDAVYGLAAVVLLGAGLTLWLGSIGKPDYYYTHNWIFLTKMGLFTAIGLLSIYPTVFFIRQRKGAVDERVSIPNSIFWMIRIELVLLAVIPLLAGLMARGVGYIGD